MILAPFGNSLTDSVEGYHGNTVRDYVERRDGGHYFVGSRVSLYPVVCEFLRGESPESIAQAFSSLTLEQVYGGLTFYLANREEIDQAVRDDNASFLEDAAAARQADPLFYEKLDAGRRHGLSRR